MTAVDCLDSADRVLVTGGAGLIGGAVIGLLLERGCAVTVFDDLSTAEPDWQDRIAGSSLAEMADSLRSRLRFIRGDIADLRAVGEAMEGHDRVIHLAANTDIAGGYADPGLDLSGCIIGTWNVLEQMRRLGIGRILYASSGVVYGNPERTPTSESYGPMLPGSHYAAAKLAGEALISGFAHLYHWRALAFRFGNTVGAASNHGVIHDLVVKLMRDSTRLEVLGDGRQRKPYIAVEDVAAGILHADTRAPDRPFAVYNVATAGTLDVRRVALLTIDALGLDEANVELVWTPLASGGGGWAGDTPLVDLDASALCALGWVPRYGPEEAVCRAARGTRDRLAADGGPLLTSAERRSSAARLPASGEAFRA